MKETEIPLPPACHSCGRCCEHFALVPISPDDDVPEGLFTHDPATGLLSMRRRAGQCVAYDPATRLCTIYERRPQACREVQRGDCMCREALLAASAQK